MTYIVWGEKHTPPTATVHVNGFMFRIHLVDEECMVVADCAGDEILGSSIQETVYGVLAEHPEVPLLRRHYYTLVEDIRTVLWSLADQGDESPWLTGPLVGLMFHTHTNNHQEA